MMIAIFLRSAAACALIAGSAVMYEAAAQSGYNTDNNSGQAPPTASDRGSSTSDPSHGQSGVPNGSDTNTGQSGASTGQDHANPGSSTEGGRGGASNAPNCPMTPPNGAECPQQGH
ncbi:MAG TPA: hypothetical protein VL966_20040 [Alphaproteobacteria bacterium]|jgi:hypothetical protein|nr:hypothetical protein [Alphaproteobacteria bacterium]